MKFQFHITVGSLRNEAEIHNFSSLCATENVKPLLIVLEKGDYIHQPMFTKVIEAPDFSIAQQQINQVIDTFVKNGFSIVRVKAEIPAEDYVFQPPVGDFTPYFEWHCKVLLTEAVKPVCLQHQAHLSLNSLDETRFVTIREYGSKELFDSRTKACLESLTEKAVPVLKEKFEYCIYDSKTDLDKGWA